MVLPSSIISALENIYISPLELCNLNCTYCYINKTRWILTNRQILSFVRRYQSFLNNFRSDDFSSTLKVAMPSPEKKNSYKKLRSNDFFSTLNVVTHSPEKKNYYEELKLKSILFCGGEVFTLKNFVRLVNNLNSKGIFITIITNGTIDKLEKIKDPRNCQLLVSFDGPEEIHDANRGKGNYQKSLDFVRHALKLGFPVEIFYLITKDSYPYKDSLPVTLAKALNLQNPKDLPFTYLTDRLHSLTLPQVMDIKKNYRTYPGRQFGCYQLALQSNGHFYGCCESSKSIGKLSDRLETVVKNFVNSLSPCAKCGQCSGCCYPDYLCGYKQELKVPHCTDVAAKFA